VSLSSTHKTSLSFNGGKRKGVGSGSGTAGAAATALKLTGNTEEDQSAVVVNKGRNNVKILKSRRNKKPHEGLGG
jgi:hypothetical protein